VQLRERDTELWPRQQLEVYGILAVKDVNNRHQIENGLQVLPETQRFRCIFIQLSPALS